MPKQVSRVRAYLPTPQDLVDLLIVSIVTAIVVAVIVWWMRGVADRSNVLSFLGAASGAGVAVLGALWVERSKVKLVDQRRATVLAEVLSEFREMLCQATYNEEPADIALPYTERFNARGVAIERTSALASVLHQHVMRIEPRNGREAQALAGFIRELERQDYLLDPHKWRVEKDLTLLAWVPQYYVYAKALGGTLLRAVDDLIGAFGYVDDRKTGHLFGVRTPHPVMRD